MSKKKKKPATATGTTTCLDAEAAFQRHLATGCNGGNCSLFCPTDGNGFRHFTREEFFANEWLVMAWATLPKPPPCSTKYAVECSRNDKTWITWSFKRSLKQAKLSAKDAISRDGWKLLGVKPWAVRIVKLTRTVVSQ